MTTEKNDYTPNEYISADASDSDMINAADRCGGGSGLRHGKNTVL